MTSTTSLIQGFSEALGVPRETVDWAARQLREAGLFPIGKGGRGGAGAAAVEVEHAVTLLLAVMTGAPVTKAVEVLNIYRDLPLTGVQMFAADAADEAHYLAPDDSLAAACPATFGDMLDTFVETWPPKLPHGLTPAALYIAAEPGAHAWIDINSVADRGRGARRGVLCYAVDPGIPGWTHLPGKARVVRLGRFAMVPAGIFEELSDLVAGDGRELVLSPDFDTSRAVISGFDLTREVQDPDPYLLVRTCQNGG